LQEINTHPSSSDEVEHIQTLRQVVGRLGEINRATFVRRDNKFILVYNGEAPVALTKAELVIPESELVIGEPIERKLAGSEKSTGLVVPNYYHPRQEYLDAIQTAGLTIVNGDEINRAMIPEQRNQYNETLSPERQLGEEYLQHSPFDLYLLTRKQPSS
ncbi:MAG TPA: hypothetical protein VLF20_00885, partial [Patescibacteria group bacterium]|nr:hypothetical protein [Patescibacteria group bacterium]